MTVVNQHRHPRKTQDSSREVTGGSLDASPILSLTPFTSLESQVGSLEGNQEQFKERLDGYNKWFDEYDNRLKH